MKDVISFSKLKAVVSALISASLPSKELEQLSFLFKQIDHNNDGFLSVTEIENALKSEKVFTDSS